jgi:hypothetical protein
VPIGYPRSPRFLKGGLVAYQLPDLLPTIIVFQYNPEELTHSLQGRSGGGGGRADALRVAGPPEQTFTFTMDLDATDQLEQPDQNPVTYQNGLHPVIAALERLMHPSYATVIANEALALLGSAFILGEQAPLALLVWGARRVLPVQLQSLTIKENAFDQSLNPIRATADVSMRVMTYRDMDITNPGYWAYMASFTQKEVLAGLNTIGDAANIRAILPF